MPLRGLFFCRIAWNRVHSTALMLRNEAWYLVTAQAPICLPASGPVLWAGITLQADGSGLVLNDDVRRPRFGLGFPEQVAEGHCHWEQIDCRAFTFGCFRPHGAPALRMIDCYTANSISSVTPDTLYPVTPKPERDNG
jgi:hypothetical protein